MLQGRSFIDSKVRFKYKHLWPFHSHAQVLQEVFYSMHWRAAINLGDAASFGGVFELVSYEVCEHVARADGIACHVARQRRFQRHRLCEACMQNGTN